MDITSIETKKDVNDIDTDPITLNILANVSSQTGRNLTQLNANATLIAPNGSAEVVALVCSLNGTKANCSASYNLTNKVLGYYNVTVNVVDQDDVTRQETEVNDFKVENISITVNMDNVVYPAQNVVHHLRKEDSSTHGMSMVDH